MAIAHVCMQCGWDQARIRPVREPRYGLNLVTCPRCGAHSVRRRHPIWAGWRWFLRIDWALSVMLVQAFMAAGLAAGTLSQLPLVLLGIATFNPDSQEWMNGAIWLSAAFVAAALATGAWLTIGFAHLPRGRVWLGWSAILVLLLAIIAVVMSGQAFTLNGRIWLGDMGAVDRLRIIFLLFFLPGTAILAGFLAIALMGIPIGRALLGMMRSFQRTKWRRRRRRRKLGRTA